MSHGLTTPQGFGRLALQVFTTLGAQTYTPTSGARWALVMCLGAGGGGGGINGVIANQGVAGSGGAGSLSWYLYQNPAAQTVTIGTGGTGGTAGDNDGTAGGDTSFGSLCIGKGGSLGAGETAGGATIGLGGLGGVAGTGTITGVGMAGQGSSGSSIVTVVTVLLGQGGSTMFGGGGRAVVNQTGTAGVGYGAGGGPGAAFNSDTDRAGGDGAPGLCAVIEFM